MEIQRNMSQVIRAYKRASRKSLKEFAKELDISRSSLQEYLDGTGNPSATTINHLAKKLDVDVAFLVSGIYSEDITAILLKLLDLLDLLAGLTQEQRMKFATLLNQMLLLWKEGETNE